MTKRKGFFEKAIVCSDEGCSKPEGRRLTTFKELHGREQTPEEREADRLEFRRRSYEFHINWMAEHGKHPIDCWSISKLRTKGVEKRRGFLDHPFKGWIESLDDSLDAKADGTWWMEKLGQDIFLSEKEAAEAAQCRANILYLHHQRRANAYRERMHRLTLDHAEHLCMRKPSEGT